MKNPPPANRFPKASTLSIIAALFLPLFTTPNAAADVVYVTARGLHGPGANDNGTYADNGYGDDSSAVSTAPGVPARNGSRYFSNSFSNSAPDSGITLSPTL